MPSFPASLALALLLLLLAQPWRTMMVASDGDPADSRGKQRRGDEGRETATFQVEASPHARGPRVALRRALKRSRTTGASFSTADA